MDRQNIEPSAPKARELIEALREQRRQHTMVLGEVERAESDLCEADSGLKDLRARIADKEAELARSGAPVSDAAFCEDAQVAKAERQRRVLAIRADMRREQAQKIQAEIERIKSKLDATWREFGKEEYGKALLSFGETAMALADQYRDLRVWLDVFPPSLSLTLPTVIVEDVPNHTSFIHSQDPVWQAKNRPELRHLHTALCAIRTELEEASG